ncbi:hypothetical protein MBLNU459_g3825t1 [Dothideomycetes sp. NU459]
MAPQLNFFPASLPVSTLKARNDLADKLEKMLENDKPWHQWETPQAYRDARRNGLNGFKKLVVNEAADTISLKSRDGGFVIGGNYSYDTYLTRLGKDLGLTMVSVEYRLAPEHPYPAGPNDCTDAALFALSSQGQSELGAPLRILGGESAGATLAVMTALTLRDEHGIDVRQQLAAICAGYGIFDLTYTPSVHSHDRAIVLSKQETFNFMEAAFGHIPLAERKTGKISPLYADLKGMPPAQFLVGTIEPLVDDSTFMAAKWLQAGNDTDLTIVDGACHAFTLIPMGDATEEGIAKLIAFVKRYI